MNVVKMLLLGQVWLYLFFSSLLAAEKYDAYLAGPLFTLGERQFNAALAEQLRQLGYTVFLPQEQEPRELTSECIFSLDVGGIDDSLVVVAIYDGSDPDSGTSWECGYAYGNKKPIIAVRTDFRGIGDGMLAPYNIMLWESSTKQIQMPSLQYNLPSLVDRIDEALQCVLNKKRQ